MASTNGETRRCRFCDRPFRVIEKRRAQEPEEQKDITCPHCRKVLGTESTNGMFVTQALSREAEMEWLEAEGF